MNTTGAGGFEGYYNDDAAQTRNGWRGGVYHSGDLAYRDEAGYAYFAGRLGDWMRVDGENLGTAPIERVLLRHPDVAEVAVYPVPDPAVGDQVMAALVLAPGAEFESDEFRTFLAEQPDLGPKQWPSYVRISAGLPRTVTFKVLKRQLVGRGCRLRRPGVDDSALASRGWATANSHRRRNYASSSNARGWWTDRRSRSACFPMAAWISSGCSAALSSPGRTPLRSSTHVVESRSWVCDFGQARCPGCSAFRPRSCAIAVFR